MNETALKHIAIVGASSAMAEHCARLWARRGGARLTLIGRRIASLESIANDLAVRGKNLQVSILEQCDACDVKDIERVVEQAWALAPVDVVLIAQGMLPDQNATQDDLQECALTLAINGDSPTLYAAAFARPMISLGKGVVALISSVASDRGRKGNYTYGAAKAMTDVFMQGLQHRLAVEKSAVRALVIKPGPTDTPMTAALKAKGAPLANVEAVAGGIVRAIDKGQRVVYLPGKWRAIMRIVKLLPRFVFDRIDI